MTNREQPLSTLKWRPRDELRPNDYNPNHVPARELDLLATSIATDGWTQPIVITPDCEIIDGFHRWHVSARPEIAAMTGGKVPTVILATTPSGRKMATVRHNRARGNHLIKHMAKLIEQLGDDGIEHAGLIAELGLDGEEIRRLTDQFGSVAELYADHEPTELEI